MKTIVLIGMMGCGKTSVGKSLSKFTNIECLDIDKEIEKNTQLSIPEIFEKFGQNHFREIEKNTILNIFQSENLIISLGGGAFENIEIQKLLLKNSTVFYLKTSPNVLFKRLKDDNTRPLLKNNMSAEYIEELINIRENNYRKAHHAIITDNKTIDQIALEILNEVSWKN